MLKIKLLALALLCCSCFFAQISLDDIVANKFAAKSFYFDEEEPEQNFFLIEDVEMIYRRSYKAFVSFVNPETGETIAVNADEKISCPTISPDIKKIAYVLNNNIFIFDIEAQKSKQITFDGAKNKIINGLSDWVYEEEFSEYNYLVWSGDSRFLSFLKFDETDIPETHLLKYNAENYPEIQTFKYPAAGKNNSKVSIWVYDVQSENLSERVSEKFDNEYFPRLLATNNNKDFAVVRLNRHQNHLQLVLFSFLEKNYSKIIYDEKSDAYIDVPEIIFLENNKEFLIQSEKSGFNQLYIVDFNGNEKAISPKNRDLSNFYHYDEKNQTVYYQTVGQNSWDRDIFYSKIKNKKLEIVKISEKEGFNSAELSGDLTKILIKHSTANTAPKFSLYENKKSTWCLVKDANNQDITEVNEENKNIEKSLQDKNFAKKIFGNLVFDDYSLPYWLLKPADFDSTKAYPLLMWEYGGPGSQEVVNVFGTGQFEMFFQYLVQQGYVVACVDNRGTGFKGRVFKNCSYLKLGEYESEDQAKAAQYFGNLSFIDENNIAIFGWSYGGYLSALCLLKYPEIFQTAIAIAPVADWTYYDNVYTERFMRSPAENPEGYSKNSLFNFVDSLQGRLLLMFGSADDNVNPANSMVFAQKLVDAGKQFDMFVYPDKNHSILGKVARKHLFTKISAWILE